MPDHVHYMSSFQSSVINKLTSSDTKETKELFLENSSKLLKIKKNLSLPSLYLAQVLSYFVIFKTTSTGWRERGQ